MWPYVIIYIYVCAWRNGSYLTIDADNGKLCMIYDHELDITLGPFPIGEWSMFVPTHYMSRVLPW